MRSYAAKGVQQPLTGAMYARLLGVDRADGDSLREQEVAYLSPAAGNDRSGRLLESMIMLGGLSYIYRPR